MYRVILVDDEEIVLERLKSCISWEDYQFTVAGTFTQADKALSYIEKEYVDLIITDVKMPGMSGIDLIREVYNRKKNIKTVILSGYDEFEYARKAIQYGASAYILKPTDDESVNNALEKVKKELDKQYEPGKLTNGINYNQVIMESILRDIVLYKNNKKAGILNSYLKGGFLYLLVVRSDQNNITPNETMINNEKMLEFLGPGKCISIRHENYFIVQFALRDHPDNKDLASYFHSIWEDANASQLFGTWEGPISRDQNIFSIFQRAKKKLEYTFYAKKGLVELPCQVLKETPDIHTIIETLDIPFVVQKILLEIEDQKVESILDDMIEILRESYVTDQFIRKIPGLFYQELLACVNETTGMSTAHIEGVPEKLYTDESGLYSFEILKSRICSLISGIKTNYYDKLTGYENVLTNLAIRYIVNHYTGDVKLEDVAKNLAVSVSSLCHIFKRVTGKSVIQYLIDYRLDKAGDIIQTTNLPINVVAEKIGYKDGRYFIKLFKKRYGISPTEMRWYIRNTDQRSNG